MAILSNGTPAMLASAVELARLGDILDEIISVDAIGVYKTDPRAYALAETSLGGSRPPYRSNRQIAGILRVQAATDYTRYGSTAPARQTNIRTSHREGREIARGIARRSDRQIGGAEFRIAEHFGGFAVEGDLAHIKDDGAVGELQRRDGVLLDDDGGDPLRLDVGDDLSIS